MREEKVRLSYYALFLKKYLTESGNFRKDDNDFINERAAFAEAEYEECRLNGMNVFESQERAMMVLRENLSKQN